MIKGKSLIAQMLDESNFYNYAKIIEETPKRRGRPFFTMGTYKKPCPNKKAREDALKAIYCGRAQEDNNGSK